MNEGVFKLTCEAIKRNIEKINDTNNPKLYYKNIFQPEINLNTYMEDIIQTQGRIDTDDESLNELATVVFRACCNIIIRRRELNSLEPKIKNMLNQGGQTNQKELAEKCRSYSFHYELLTQDYELALEAIDKVLNRQATK